MLGIDDAASFLLDRGLVNVGAILDGDLVIASAARRNRNLRVDCRGGGYLLKQPGDPSEGGHATLRAEAAFYDYCRTEPTAAAMRDILPRLAYQDPAEAVLAVELCTGAQPLWMQMAAHQAPSPPREVFRALGRALGVFHRAFQLVGGASDPKLAWLTRMIPWVMLVHKPGPEILATLSPANYQTLKILQTQVGLPARLDALRKQWRSVTVIHNDIKSDNILVRVGAEPGTDGVEVRIVDWELVQFGDPAWDLAGALQDLVLFWVQSMPLSGDQPADGMMEAARYPLGSVQAACRALWAGYRAAAGPIAAEDGGLLTRAVAFSAARMIQSAYEMAFGAMALPSSAVVLLQVSANILDDPELAQVRLYGLHGGAIF